MNWVESWRAERCSRTVENRQAGVWTVLALTLVTVSGLSLISGVAGCASSGDREDNTVTIPAGWSAIRVGDAVTLAVPPDAREQKAQPIDSIVGILLGDGYEVIYDYGRYGGRLSAYKDRPGYKARTRSVYGRVGTEISFQADGQPWGVVRILQVEDGQDVLTIRVSCVDDDACRMADDLFDSIKFISR